MDIDLRWIDGMEDRFRARDLCIGAMRHHQEAIRLDDSLVFDDAVPGNAETVERSSEATQATDDECAFDYRQSCGRKRAQDDRLSEYRNGKDQPAEEKSPQSPYSVSSSRVAGRSALKAVRRPCI